MQGVLIKRTQVGEVILGPQQNYCHCFETFRLQLQSVFSPVAGYPSPCHGGRYLQSMPQCLWGGAVRKGRLGGLASQRSVLEDLFSVLLYSSVFLSAVILIFYLLTPLIQCFLCNHHDVYARWIQLTERMCVRYIGEISTLIVTGRYNTYTNSGYENFLKKLSETSTSVTQDWCDPVSPFIRLKTVLYVKALPIL